ncbi:ABC transporter ATP-binding protein [Consotaella salsifontis]|uniref:Carbohydrate ABC transporter ATP-binding protein, CUT1 family n=1 Tax=Consotaella salsifontis TaxID=1365950 RepID=A0A1T4S8Q9_9HYPH|nr:sn-glycerol-3-phosphate ABC transporter ATP-binding protein UgpC [Consotaella salsifontis]SKA24288.1 carbohydrate ABC transporter ATP-binding protein, CUT1 family [Consotaella salsifontis]
MTDKGKRSLLLKGIRKSYGAVPVLKGIDIAVEEGAFIVLLGPSGCGKSTLLHAIAGLHPIDEGLIEIDGRDVTSVPTRERDVAMVFQSYALYPNMTVGENIAFPLRMRGVGAAEKEGKVAEVARLLQIEPLLDRKPRALSGGQRQRVAIGRALVRDPKVFLFDEPLSNLDATLRVETRAEIKQLHERIGKTMIYVTHDQIEAMTLATKIVVMNKGEVQQIGSPYEIYHRPANLFVAKFVGSPAMHFLPGALSREDGRLIFDDGKGWRQELALSGAAGVGGEVLLGIRPEHIRPARDGQPAIEARVEMVESTGPEDNVTLSLHGHALVARMETGSVRQGEVVPVTIATDKVSLFDAASGRMIGTEAVR